MLYCKNPLRWLRRVGTTLKGLSNYEVKLVYAAGVSLAGAAVLTAALQLAVMEKQELTGDAPVRFTSREIVLENRFDHIVSSTDQAVSAVASVKADQVQQERTVTAEENAKVTWYFDEVHQDWRCRRE